MRLSHIVIVLAAFLPVYATAEEKPVVARYVHISLPGKGRILSLAEVQVLSKGKNVARGKKVAQSSIYGGAGAGRAVDGNTSGEWGRGSITHTAVKDAAPAWEVDLGAMIPVEAISLWNRDGLEDRLHGVELRLLDAKRKVLWGSALAKTTSGENRIPVKGASLLKPVGASVPKVAGAKAARNAPPPKPAGPPPPKESYSSGTEASLEMAIKDMAATWPELFADTGALLEQLKAAAADKDPLVLKRFQHKILLRNPMLNFDKLLVIRRKKGRFLTNNWLSNSALPKTGHENSIVQIRISNPEEETVVYRPEKGEFVGDVDLHWNGDRMLFSSIGQNGAWQVMEIGLDGKNLREVTQTKEPFINNYDPCYLPDGRILFTSTAPMASVPCINGKSPIANLFRCNKDGSGMEQLCFDQEHNWCPQVMHDGRILYLRWEYTDLAHANSRILMTMNPDGTNQRSYYGTSSWWPNGVFYARQIPGNSSQFVGIVTGHHGVRREGEMTLFDVSKGYRNADGALQRLPGYGKKVEPIVADRLVNGSPNRALHPYPLGTSENAKGAGTYYLAVFKAGKEWGVFLVDRFDNRTFICKGIEPVPVQKLPIPPVIPDRVRPGKKEANIFISDIYEGPGLKDIPRDSVKALRLFTYTYGHNRGLAGLYGVIGMDGPWDMRRILGTVPVEPDGSASFKVPANTPISIQPLDEEGKAMQIMRSWFTARPGEQLGCVGCHEAPNTAPPMRMPAAARKAPASITPWKGPVRNYEFVREVQPVLDAYCLSCHGGSKPEGKGLTIEYEGEQIPYLAGDLKLEGYKTRHAGNGGRNAGHFTRSYFNLFRYTRHSGIESEMQVQMPMEFHADTTELITMLEKGHPATGPKQVKLSKEHMDRLVMWIDLNRPFYGRWSQRSGDYALKVEKQRADLRKRYAGVEENHEDLAPPEAIPVVAPVAAADRPEAPALEAKVNPRPEKTTQSLTLADDVPLELVYVPGGEFAMGSVKGYRDEAPMARVAITKGFWMGKLEVTNRQFKLFDPDHESRREDRHGYQFGAVSFPVDAPDQPAVRLSWQQANAFCQWLSKKSGKTVRLPTEAEWEWACRAGTTTAMHYGAVDADFAKHGNMADSMLHHFSSNPYKNDWKTAGYKNADNIHDNWIPQIGSVNDGGFLSVPGGKYQSNAWGLCDMHGNVAEWTASLYKPYPYAAEDGRNDLSGKGRRVVRGGSWRDRPKLSTSSARRAYRDYQKVFNVGFRVVVEE